MAAPLVVPSGLATRLHAKDDRRARQGPRCLAPVAACLSVCVVDGRSLERGARVVPHG